MREFPFYLAGKPGRSDQSLDVINPYDGSTVGRPARLLEVGGVIVNDVPTWRIDQMPYGGVKDSGPGREGPRYTIEEMTEPRLLVINRQLS